MDADADADARPPFSPLAHFLLPDLLLTLLLTTYPRPLPRLLVYLVFVCFTLHNLRYTSGSVLQDYALGSVLAGRILTATHLLWLVGPPDTWRHESDVLPARQQGVLRRFVRMLAVVYSPRGVGSRTFRSIPPRGNAYTPRGVFLSTCVRDIALYLLLLDLSQTYMRMNPLFSQGRPLGAQGALLRVVNIVAFMGTQYSLLNLQYAVAALIGVGFGVGGSQVQDWPGLYGRWADAWSVRQFWGRTWHQMLRFSETDMGVALVSLLGFRRGTGGSAYTQLCTSFALSGLVHVGGDYMVAPDAVGSSMKFFLLQAVAVTLEDGVIALGRRSGLPRDGRAWRALGYCWVAAWFWWSVPLLVDWILARGAGRSGVLPVSIVQSVGRWAGAF